MSFISPESSISFVLAKKTGLDLFITTEVGKFPQIAEIVKQELQKYNMTHLEEYVLGIPVLFYNFYIKKSTGADVYSFLVYDGYIGEHVDDKIFYDENGEIVSYEYIISVDTPHIVLSKFRRNDQEFQKASIIHEVAHLIFRIAQDDKVLDDLKLNIPDELVTNVDQLEIYPIMLESSFLKSEGKSEEEIMKYMMDRYMVDINPKDPKRDLFIEDLRNIVSFS